MSEPRYTLHLTLAQGTSSQVAARLHDRVARYVKSRDSGFDVEAVSVVSAPRCYGFADKQVMLDTCLHAAVLLEHTDALSLAYDRVHVDSRFEARRRRAFALMVRSSTPLKYRWTLSNNVGLIDIKYADSLRVVMNAIDTGYGADDFVPHTELLGSDIVAKNARANPATLQIVAPNMQPFARVFVYTHQDWLALFAGKDQNRGGGHGSTG